MTVLLLSGYFHNIKKEEHPALFNFQGQLWMDWQLAQIEKLGHKPIVVLGDNFSEDILSQSTQIAKAGLVFDTNGTEATMNTNIKAGLAQVQTTCAVMSVCCPCPTQKTWQKLIHHSYKSNLDNSQLDFCQSFSPVKGSMKPVFPLLISSFGARHIAKLSNFKGSNDPRVSFSPVPVIGERSEQLEKWGLTSLISP